MTPTPPRENHDPERVHALWRHLLATTAAVQADLAGTSTATGLDDRALAVLDRLAGAHDRSLRFDRLATDLGLTSRELAESVGGLEAQGRVRRAASRSLPAVVHVVLTPSGLDAAHRLGPLRRREVVARLGDLLGDEGLCALATLLAALPGSDGRHDPS